MTAAAWARRRTEVEWVGLAAALAVFGYVGWDGALWDPRLQLLLHLAAAGCALGLSILLLRGAPLPRTRIDLPLLALLAAFALATVSALNVGMSLRAMAAISATALMLPVALLALRHRPSWLGIVTSVPVLLLSVISLATLLVRRIEWVVAGAPGLPPIRLPSEGTPFGSVAVPPFVIWPAWALAGLIEPPGLRRAVRTGLVIVGVPLTILSGSRSAWLAIGVALLVAGVPWAWQHRSRLRMPRRVTWQVALIALGGLVVGAGLLTVIVPRLTAVTSLLYRASLWRDTLNAWASDPLLGIGPGLMPWARQAAAPDFSFPVRQPHSHNLPLGLLGDAGVLGLLAGLALVATVAWVAGPWRARTSTGRVAGVVLIGLALGGLFEDLTFLPNFNLLAIAVLAVALADAGAVEWVRPRRRLALAAGAGAAAVVLAAAMVTADAGAIAYRAGTDAAAAQRWSDATERLARAAAIDPWQPTGPKALAVAAEAAGAVEQARDAAAEAVRLNPGDAASWTNLSLLCTRLGDAECAASAAGRAAATAGFLESELVNSAFTYEALGRTAEADDAYRRSLLSQRLTSLATDWPRTIEIGEAMLLDQAGPQVELHVLLARHAMGEPFEPDAIGDPATRALAHALLGERDAAEDALTEAIGRNKDTIPTWDMAIVLRDHWGLPLDEELEIAGVVRGRPFPSRDAEPTPPGLIFDIASFRAYPGDGLVRDAVRLRTEPPYPWVLGGLLP